PINIELVILLDYKSPMPILVTNRAVVFLTHPLDIFEKFFFFSNIFFCHFHFNSPHLNYLLNSSRAFSILSLLVTNRFSQTPLKFMLSKIIHMPYPVIFSEYFGSAIPKPQGSYFDPTTSSRIGFRYPIGTCVFPIRK